MMLEKNYIPFEIMLLSQYEFSHSEILRKLYDYKLILINL